MRAAVRSSVWHFVSDTYRKWSAHDVELALWSFHFAKKLHPDLLKTTNSEPNDEPRGKNEPVKIILRARKRRALWDQES